MSARIGVIGVRNVGMGHVRSWSKAPGARVTAIADLDRQRLEQASAGLDDVRLFGDYRELLDKAKVDIVSVCLPTGIHGRVVADCAAAGVHILCEKPPANDAAEAQRMLEVAKRAGITLGYSLQERFRKQVQSARAAVADGRAGDVYYARIGYVRTAPWEVPQAPWRTPWRFDAQRGGGSLLDLGVHILDATWYLMGCPRPQAVTGFTSSRMIPDMVEGLAADEIGSPADDTAAALIKFEGQRAILLESSFGIYRPTPSIEYCELTGTQGGISVPDKGSSELVRGVGERSTLTAPEGPAGRDAMVLDFLSAVEEGRQPIVSAEQGVTLMRMLDAIIASNERGTSVAV